MELQEAIMKRRTARKFKPDMLSDEDIKKIINSARIAPSATNSQNWLFIAVKNREILAKMKKVIEDKFNNLISLTTDENRKNMLERFKDHSTFFVNAPVTFAIVETSKISIFGEEVKKLNLSAEQQKYVHPDSSLLSLGGAIENMCLTATDLGYHTCWMSAPIIAGLELAEVLNLKEGEHVISLLPTGIADGELPNPHKKSLEEVMQII